MFKQFYETHKKDIIFLTSKNHLIFYYSVVSVLMAFIFKESIIVFHNETLKSITSLRFFCPVWVYRYLFMEKFGSIFVIIYSALIYICYITLVAVSKQLKMAVSSVYDKTNNLTLSLNSTNKPSLNNYNLYCIENSNSGKLSSTFV